MGIKKIILITALFIVLVYSATILTALKLEFKFLGFEKLLISVTKKEPVEFNLEVKNKSIFGLKIKALKVRIVSKEGKEVLSFLPVDFVINGNSTAYTKFTFEKGNAIGLLGDYLNKSYKTYKVIVKGRVLGIFPIYYKTKLLTD